jgi:hypothetical protein
MSDTDAPEVEPKVSYLIQQQGGDFIIEISPEWKLTFGAVNPGGQMSGRDLHCVRVWDGANAKTARLKAVYCDCRGFRDLSIPLARKVQRETGSSSWVQDSSGNFERSEQRQVTETIVSDRLDPEDIPF